MRHIKAATACTTPANKSEPRLTRRSSSFRTSSIDSGANSTPNLVDGGSKLRANRERRRRARDRGHDELEQKFSNLSVSAPVFTPKTPTTSTTTRIPPAFKRLQQQQHNMQAQQSTTVAPTPMSAWTLPVPVPTEGSATQSNISQSQPSGTKNNRPRRQRIGSLGFAQSKGATTHRRRSSNVSVFNKAAPSFQVLSQVPDTASLSINGDSASRQTHRRRSSSRGSDSETNSDDDVYPDNITPNTTSSAFPDRLTLLGQQRKVPKDVVSRDAVIDTVFAALFAKNPTREKPRDDDEDDTGTDTDEPNEEFVKRGLAASLFKDTLSATTTTFDRSTHPQDPLEQYITSGLIHTLVTALRFEDFRTASARIDILRAVHKACPYKRIHIAKALVDATSLRYQYVQVVVQSMHTQGIERNRVMVQHPHDHSHGFIELLRYAIEHMGSEQMTTKIEQEIVRNYMVALVTLWKTHWYDSTGSDEEELITCVGQLVSYLPHIAIKLLQQLVGLAWPRRFPTQQVIAIRMIARVIMSSPPMHTLDKSGIVPLQIFRRLAQCIQSSHTQVAQEALAFTGCPFAMIHFLGVYSNIYHCVSEAFHHTSRSHWNEKIRSMAETNFDRALDYAP